VNSQIRRGGIDWSWPCALAVIWAISIFFFTPLLTLFPALIIPSYFPDAFEFIWTSWRLEGVLDGTKQLYTSQDIYAPDGASLLLHTISEGILLPVTALFAHESPVWRFNISIIAVFLANGATSLSLFRALGCTAVSAAMCSLLVTFAPFMINHIAAGHINLLALFPLFEALRGMIVFSGLTRSPDALFSLNAFRYFMAIPLLILTNLYYLYFYALLCGLMIVSQIAFRRQLTRAMVYTVGIFIAGLVPLSPHLLAIARLALSKTYTPDHNAGLHSADLAAYLAPSTSQVAYGLPWAQYLRAGISLHEVESSLYVSFSLLALALLSCFQTERHLRQLSRCFLFVSALFCLLSLGPNIKWMSSVVCINPLDRLLRAVLPLYPSVPVRCGIISILSLVAAGSLCISKVNPARIRALGLLFLGCAIIESAPMPLKTYPVRQSSAVLEALALDHEARIVLDFARTPQFSMLRQTIHHKPIVGGYLSRRPKASEAALRKNSFLRMLRRGKLSDSRTIQEAWCALSADRLLLEQPVATETVETLLALGFIRTDADDWVVLFAPSTALCQQPKSRQESRNLIG